MPPRLIRLVLATAVLGVLARTGIAANAQAIALSRDLLRGSAISNPDLDRSGAGRLLGLFLFRSGRHREAEQVLLTHLARDPGDGMSQFLLGRIYRETAREPEAITAWRSAGAAPYFARVGFELNEQGQRAEAEKAFLTAVAIDPNLVDPYEQLARLYWGDRDRTVWALDRVIALSADTAPSTAQYAEARRAYTLQRWADADALFERVAATMSDAQGEKAWLYMWWSECRYHRRDLAGTEELLKKSLAILPTNFWVPRRLAALYEDQGRTALAADAYRLATRQTPEWAEGHAHLARLLQRMGCRAAARSSAAEAVRLAPDESGYAVLAAELAANQRDDAHAPCAGWAADAITRQ